LLYYDLRSLERFNDGFNLRDPVVDGACLELFKKPSACRLNYLELSAACLDYSAVLRQDNRSLVLHFILIVLDLSIPVEFECAPLTHVKPVDLAHIAH
jgi:hypothetical protein